LQAASFCFALRTISENLVSEFLIDVLSNIRLYSRRDLGASEYVTEMASDPHISN